MRTDPVVNLYKQEWDCDREAGRAIRAGDVERARKLAQRSFAAADALAEIAPTSPEGAAIQAKLAATYLANRGAIARLESIARRLARSRYSPADIRELRAIAVACDVGTHGEDGAMAGVHLRLALKGVGPRLV